MTVAEIDVLYKLAKRTREIGVYPGLRKDALGHTLEKQALVHALRSKYGISLPGPGTLHNYLAVTGRLAHQSNAPEHKAYAEHIDSFKGGTLAQPQVEEASKHLQNSGLIEAANKLLTGRKGHTPLPEPIVKPAARGPSGFVEIPDAQQSTEPKGPNVRAAVTDAVGPGIKPATDETIKPVSMRPADVKKRRETPAAEFVDDSKPLPLADVPADKANGKTRDRHSLIGELVLRRTPSAAIVQRLADQFNITPRAAKETLGRWIKQTRAGLPPDKLARKGQTDPHTKEQVADLYSGVDSHIAGTRMAKHLIDITKEFAPGGARDNQVRYLHPVSEEERHQHATIHALAKAALAGKGMKGTNGDVYAALGQRLADVGHKHAKSYNWHTMDRSLREDQFLKDFVKKNVQRPEGISDREFWSKVLNTYARDHETLSRERHPDPKSHGVFWARLQKAYQNHPLGMTEAGNAGGKLSAKTVQRLTDSMYRHHTLADDRETSGGIDAKKDKNWRNEFSWLWGNKHMKFNEKGEKVYV